MEQEKSKSNLLPSATEALQLSTMISLASSKRLSVAPAPRGPTSSPLSMHTLANLSLWAPQPVHSSPGPYLSYPGIPARSQQTEQPGGEMGFASQEYFKPTPAVPGPPGPSDCVLIQSSLLELSEARPAGSELGENAPFPLPRLLFTFPPASEDSETRLHC